MSGGTHGVNIIIEWSPRKISVYDVATQVVKDYDHTDALPYGGKSAVLAISRKSIFVRATRVPNAAPEEIRLVVQVKLAELFPVPPHELAYDFMPLSDVNAEGRLALIMAIQVTELRRAKEKLASSGIKVVRTLPLALAAPLIAESLGLHDAAVIENGSDFVSVDLVAGGILRYSRVVPPSSPIDVEVNRTYNAAGLACAQTIAAGGVVFGEANKSTKLSSLQALATGHLDRFKVNIELPEVVAARELNARKRRGFVAGAMLLCSFIAAYFAYSDYMAETSAGSIQLDRAQKNLVASQDYQKKAQSEADRQTAITKILSGAFHPAQNVADIAAIAANCAPSGIWLTGMNIERGKEMTVRGTSKTDDVVSDFVTALNNFPDPESGQLRFRNAKLLFGTAGEVQKLPVVDFSVSAFPVGNLPIALQQKAGASPAPQ